MKIALLFSGQPRNICEKTFQSFHKHLLSKYEVDVYAHFWFDNGDFGESYAPWVEKRYLAPAPAALSDFQTFYNPKKVLTDPPLPFVGDYEKYTNIAYKNAAYNIFSLYTSRQRAFQLLTNPDEYDLIIRARTDMEIDYLPVLEKTDVVNVMNLLSWKAANADFLLAPPNLMKIIANAVDILDVLHERGVKFNDEELFYETMHHYGLLEKIKEKRLHYHICRE